MLSDDVASFERHLRDERVVSPHTLKAYSLDVGGKHVGSVLGWSNMFGNLGAAISPIALNMIIGDDMNYQRMFLACAAAFVLAGVLALFIDATKPIVPVGRHAA